MTWKSFFHDETHEEWKFREKWAPDWEKWGKRTYAEFSVRIQSETDKFKTDHPIGSTVIYLHVHWMVSKNCYYSKYHCVEFPTLVLERINKSDSYETVIPASFDLVFPAGPGVQVISNKE